MTERQKTIARPAHLAGIGLHTGHPVELTFYPADPGKGIRFRRADVGTGVEIPALTEFVVEISRGTVLGRDGAKVYTVEHVLAAVAGLGIDNIIIELSADEPPIMDGSAGPFVTALQDAGIVEQDAPREYFEVEKTLTYHSDKDAVDIVVVPSTEFRITYMIDYTHPSIGTQYTSMYSLDEFASEFATARTFCLLSETENAERARADPGWDAGKRRRVRRPRTGAERPRTAAAPVPPRKRRQPRQRDARQPLAAFPQRTRPSQDHRPDRRPRAGRRAHQGPRAGGARRPRLARRSGAHAAQGLRDAADHPQIRQQGRPGLRL